MNWSSWLAWGFASTVILTTISASARGLGLTRMNIPFMLGTVFTSSRDKAKLYGLFAHMTAGWIFSLIYIAFFQVMGAAGWWRGAIMGAVHGLFVLTVGMALLPGLHPRMASELSGPEAQKKLEPPGFMALHYGVPTPVAVMVSHVAFGTILGAFYRVV